MEKPNINDQLLELFQLYSEEQDNHEFLELCIKMTKDNVMLSSVSLIKGLSKALNESLLTKLSMQVDVVSDMFS